MSQRSDGDGEIFESTDPESSEASFVRRWSRRKRDALARADRIAPLEAADSNTAEEASPLADEADAAALTDVDMPAIESLAEDSDFDGFLSPGVSEELRRLALRKLFHLPGFNVRDGLDDYDEDFTRFAALGDVMTQDLRHRLKTAAKRDAERERQSAPAEEADGGSVPPAAGQASVAEDGDPGDVDECGALEPDREESDANEGQCRRQ